jgi:hypothetical protein
MILPDGAEEADVYECDLTKREITWTTEKDLLSALKAQKLDLKPLRCGGRTRSPSGASSGPTARTRSRCAGRRPDVRPQREDGRRVHALGYTSSTRRTLARPGGAELWKPARSTSILLAPRALPWRAAARAA